MLNMVFRNNYNQFGLSYEHIQYDPDSYTELWTDNAVSFMARKKIKSFLFNTRLTSVISKNYGWVNAKNRFNFMGMMGVSYFF
jgi:hypothetical protein